MLKKKNLKMMDYHIKQPTFNHNSVDFLMCKTDLETNLVTIKNLTNGKKKDIDYDKLQKILKR